jgi:hypothetical protein
MKLFSVLLALIQLIIIDSVHAAAIGMPENTARFDSIHTAAIDMPENTARFGYALGMARLSIDDPDGATDTVTEVQPITFTYTNWLNGGYRYWSELYYQQTSLDASTTAIGQDIAQYGLRFSVQRNLPMGDNWTPWLGLGLDLSRSDYSKRHTVDSDGFLLERFSDRDETGLGLVINLVTEWGLRDDWYLSAKLEQIIPLGNGLKATSLSIGVLYSY